MLAFSCHLFSKNKLKNTTNMCHSSASILVTFIRYMIMELCHRYGELFQFVKVLKRKYLHSNGLTTREVILVNFSIINRNITSLTKGFCIYTREEFNNIVD